MKIFRRFADGMFSPYNVNNYIDDKKGLTVIYFIFLIILMIIPTTISTIITPTLSYDDRVELRETFYHDEEEIPFYINSSILFNDNHDNDYVYKKEFGSNGLLIIKANDEVMTNPRYATIIELSRTGVFIHQFGIRRLLFAYKDYSELTNIKLSKSYENDGEFWGNVFSVLDKELPKEEGLYKAINIVLLVLSTAFSLVLWSLIFTIFNRPADKRGLSFAKYWQMVIYLLTPYAICFTVSKMFSLSLVYYLGLVWTIINIMRFSQRIVFIKGDENDEL